MQQRNTAWLILIFILVLGAVYVVVPGTGIPQIGTIIPETKYTIRQGLDLQGGLQVLLEADVPPGTELDSHAMDTAKTIVEQRVNGLGVTEPLVQRQGASRIVVELPGVKDPQAAIDLLKQTGLLEFVYAGTQFLPEDTVVKTDCVDPSKVDCGTGAGATTPPATATPTVLAPTATTGATATLSATATTSGTVAAATTPEAAPTPAPTAAASATLSASPTTEPAGPVYHTVMTGVALRTAIVGTQQTGEVVVNFELTDAGSRIFSDFTSQHVGEILAIVLDKKVISSPRIDSAITQGQGTITGSFTIESANQLAVQLRYGALPVPLKVGQSREIGPTLGQDSLRKSAIAGIIGITAVILFMLLYYRLPGIVASAALLIYALITIAIFKGALQFIGIPPVTLTLPGIAGFVLSVGVAVDANILIFERMKEELRAGRNLRTAVDAGFSRAWPSIRDSNISTLITCLILYLFGNAYGASIVKGFALTLALGVGVSLFTAILVTRSILHLFLDRIDFSARHSWFGI
ncbi:MAG: secD [Anaerolineales bacterium]|nr:secD [Anaerolineales bacterium]